MLRLRFIFTGLAAALLLSSCDMPTESPSFAFDTKVKAPLLYESSYQLIGSPASEAEALIDTTAGELDTLFQTSGANNTISISRSIDDFDVGSLDGVIPDIAIDPVAFSVSGDEALGKTAKTARAGKSAAATVTFSEEGSLALDIDNVSFSSADDFVALDGGSLVIEEIVNEFDVGFQQFTILIPSLRAAPYGEDDALRITFSHSESAEDDYHYPAITANDTRQNIEIPLENLHLVPTDDKISYSLDGETEEITDPTAVQSDDEVRGTLNISDISFQKVQATVATTTVDLTSDTDNDGQLEITSDAEATVAAIGGLGDIRDWFSSFQLTGTELRLTVETNLPAHAEIYAAVRGENAEGETVYLRGKNGASVENGEVESGLFSGKTGALTASKLIKIPIAPSSDPTSGGKRTISLALNNENSNVEEFLNILPTEIRFVGRGRVNPNGPQQMTLTRPVQLDASLEAYLPLQVSGEALTVNDTMEVDFSAYGDAASSGESMQFREGSLEVTYENGFPVGADLELEVLDANHQPIGVSFGGEDVPISIEPAAVEDGFAAAPAQGIVELTLSDDQLDVLDQGRYLEHKLLIRARENETVSLQGDNTISLGVRGSFDIRVSTQ